MAARRQFGGFGRGLGAARRAVGAWRGLAALVAACFLLSSIAAGRAQEAATLERLDIATASGAHSFLVEVMRTDEGRERGLMFRRALAPDHGMLFDFGVERPIDMWMRNTYLPLDMIFLSRTGRVVAIAENAEPMSERIIPSRAPAFGVLEVNAGVAARIGLKVGDRVRHPMFGR